MIVKYLDVQLQIDSGDKSDKDYCYLLRTKSKHITNYIERNCLKSLKFYSDYFQGIVITLRYGYEKKFTDIEPYITPNKSVGIALLFNKEKYDGIKTNNAYREFIYTYLVEAFKKVETIYEIPSSEILASYKELKENSFVNEWLFKKKTDRTRKLLTELHCSLTIDRFELTLKVYQDKKEVYNKPILETSTNEIAYQNKFNDLKIESDKIVILTKRNKVLQEFSFKELGVKG